MKHPAHGGNLVWAAALAGCSPSEIVDFSASISPLGPPESVIAAIKAHLSAMRSYPDPNYGQVRAALSQFHQLPPEWILPGNGAAELLTWAAWDLAELEATVLITPAFSDYFRALNAFSGKVIRCPFEFDRVEKAEPREPGKLGNQALPPAVGLVPLTADAALLVHRLSPPPFDQILALCPSPQTCGLLINNPHNPMGYLYDRTALLPYLKQFALVVVDEAFMDFLPPDRQQSLINDVQQYPNLVILRSLTKFYSLPGLRFGYAIGHPDRITQWQQRRDPWSVNVLASAAAIASVQDTAFQQQTWAWLAGAQPKLFQGLAALPGLHPYPSAVNFFLVRSQPSAPLLQQTLLQTQQILIRDCQSFPELGEYYFRVAVKSDADNQRLLQGLANVLKN